VKKGDDLKKIGKKYGLTVADLERINRFGAHHTELQVGQKITVYREMTKAEKEKAACKITPSQKLVPPKESAPEPVKLAPEKERTPERLAKDDDAVSDTDESPRRAGLPRPPPPDGRP